MKLVVCKKNWHRKQKQPKILGHRLCFMIIIKRIGRKKSQAEMKKHLFDQQTTNGDRYI